MYDYGSRWEARQKAIHTTFNREEWNEPTRYELGPMFWNAMDDWMTLCQVLDVYGVEWDELIQSSKGWQALVSFKGKNRKLLDWKVKHDVDKGSRLHKYIRLPSPDPVTAHIWNKRRLTHWKTLPGKKKEWRRCKYTGLPLSAPVLSMLPGHTRYLGRHRITRKKKRHDEYDDEYRQGDDVESDVDIEDGDR